MGWIHATLRGSRVLAKCDEAGNLVAEGGRVEIRYKKSATKAYRAGLRNLTIEDGAKVLPDSHCAEASAAPSKKKSAKKKTVAPSSYPTEPKGNEVLAYADGACSGNPGPAGLGVVMRFGDSRKELSEFIGDGTNNIAELMAIQRAAENMPDNARPLRLYTDSSYSIGLLQKGWKAKKNQELVAAVKKALAKLDDWKLMHVKGHAGIELNERADELARVAVEARATAGWQDKPASK